MPEIASFIVSSVIFLLELSKLIPDIIKPGVQYPHCEACSLVKATCKGCGFLSQPRPSIVVTELPITWPNLTKQAFIGLELPLPVSSIITEQAPQSPSAQPSLVPVIL